MKLLAEASARKMIMLPPELASLPVYQEALAEEIRSRRAMRLAYEVRFQVSDRGRDERNFLMYVRGMKADKLVLRCSTTYPPKGMWIHEIMDHTSPVWGLDQQPRKTNLEVVPEIVLGKGVTKAIIPVDVEPVAQSDETLKVFRVYLTAEYTLNAELFSKHDRRQHPVQVRRLS